MFLVTVFLLLAVPCSAQPQLQACFQEPAAGTSCQVLSMGDVTFPTPAPTKFGTNTQGSGSALCVPPGGVLNASKVNEKRCVPSGPTPVPTPLQCPPVLPFCKPEDQGTATATGPGQRRRQTNTTLFRCDKSYTFEYAMNIAVPVNAVNARISFCLNSSALLWCQGCAQEILKPNLAPLASLNVTNQAFQNMSSAFWFKKASAVRNFHSISEIDSRTESLDVEAGEQISCWYTLNDLAVRLCFETLEDVQTDYSVYGDAIVDKVLRISSGASLTMGGSLLLEPLAMTNVTTTSTIVAEEDIVLDGILTLDIPDSANLTEGVPVTYSIASSETGTISGGFSSFNYNPPSSFQPCQNVLMEPTQTSNTFSVTLTLDNAACATANPTSLAPTSFSPTSKIPTSRAPTSLSPTSLSPTSQVPTSKMPTSSQPTSNAPTSQSPTSRSPTTLAPTLTIGPTSLAPTSLSPTSSTPTSLSPSSVVPTSNAPTSKSPTSLAPTSVNPTSLSPTSRQPTSAAPTSAQPTAPLPPPSLINRNLGAIVGGAAGALFLGVLLAIAVAVYYRHERKNISKGFANRIAHNVAHDLEHRMVTTFASNSMNPATTEEYSVGL